jgi:hypothetical protein
MLIEVKKPVETVSVLCCALDAAFSRRAAATRLS